MEGGKSDLKSDLKEETFHFLCSLSIEAYRERIVRVLDFLYDTACNGTSEPQDALFNSLVSYVLEGEAAFVAAHDAAQAHLARYDALCARKEALKQREQLLTKRINVLQEARTQASSTLFEALQLEKHFKH